MCGRFELDASPRQVRRQFDLTEDPALPNLEETRPTDMALIILSDKKTVLRSWGFPAPWEGKGSGKPIFNARSETLQEKAVFAPYLANRCIVPATSFPEWRKDGKQRFRYRISLNSRAEEEKPIMAFAGLHDENYFTILTCPACEKMATVHNRMPVILTNEVVSEWLNPDRDLPSLENHLHPYQGDDLMVEEDFTPQQKSDLRQADLFS